MSKKSILINFFLICIAVISSMSIYNQSYVDKDYSKIDLRKTNKLMIVAHPDDEMIFGGAHLLSDDYLVVCVTCGLNKVRVNEFQRVMKETNDQFIMLGYPDKVLNIRSNWKDEKNQIYEDISKIISLKNWDTIVTHNFNGEYGHLHHRLLNQIVTDVYNDLNRTDDLYFFGKYYTKSKLSMISMKPAKIDSKLYKEKVRIIELYKSQNFIKERFGHMFPYEEWTKYDNIVSYDRGSYEK